MWDTDYLSRKTFFLNLFQATVKRLPYCESVCLYM